MSTVFLRTCLIKPVDFRSGTSVILRRSGSLLDAARMRGLPCTFLEATEKLKTYSFWWLLAVDWSTWRRLQRGRSDKLETPQGIARGGSRSPRGKRSHLRKVTAVFNPNLKLCTSSVASPSSRRSLRAFHSNQLSFLNVKTITK